MRGIRKSPHSLVSLLVKIVSLTTILVNSSASVAQTLHVDKGSGFVYHAYFRKVAEEDPGTVHLLIANTTSNILAIRKLCLNGCPTEQMPNDFVFWYRTVPEVARPTEVMDVMLKMRRVTHKPIRVDGITNSGSQVSIILDAIPPGLKFSFVGHSKELDKVYLYLQNQSEKPLRIQKLWCNLDEITSRCWIPEPTIPSHSKALVVFSPPSKLRPGDYLAFKVLTDKEVVAAAQTRIYTHFPIAAFYGDTRTEFGFDEVPFDMPFPSSQAEFEQSQRQPSHRVYHVFNDPACNDGRAGQLIGTNMKQIAKRTAECYEKDHIHPSIIYLCHHLCRFSYCVYGEATDIIAADPYQMQNRQDQPMKNAEYMALAKKATEPRMLWSIPEAWTDLSRQRFPTPEEERIIVYSEIGEGSKGVWYFSAKQTSGYRRSPPLEGEIGRINNELCFLRDYIVVSEPFSLATTNNEKVRPYSLLCGDKGIVLILINLSHQSSFDTGKPAFTYYPQEGLLVECRIPEWFKLADVVSVEDGKSKKIDYHKVGNTLVVPIERLDITKQILITGGRAL